jgi:hypothetical protein
MLSGAWDVGDTARVYWRTWHRAGRGPSVPAQEPQAGTRESAPLADEGPPTFGLPEHSSLTWEGERERSWMSTWNLLDPRRPRVRRAYKIICLLQLLVLPAVIIISHVR